MFELNSLKTNREKENNGVEISLGGDSSITIAAWGNDTFTDMLQKEMEPYAALQRINKVPEAVAEKALWSTIAQTIIKGWKNLSLDGVALEYSPENAYNAIKENRRFRAFVIENSQNLQLFQDGVREQGAKN